MTLRGVSEIRYASPRKKKPRQKTGARSAGTKSREKSPRQPLAYSERGSPPRCVETCSQMRQNFLALGPRRQKEMATARIKICHSAKSSRTCDVGHTAQPPL